MKVIDLFSVPLYSTFLNVDNNALESFALSERDNNPGRKLSNIGGWQSQDYHDPLPEELQELFGIIGDNCNYFAAQIRLLPPIIQNVWININGHKDFNALHTHPHSTFSGVYYVKGSTNHGKLNFRHPESEMIMAYGWQDPVITEHNRYNSGLYSYDIEPGLLYIFPSWIRHEVMPNLTHDERISISFNYKIVL